MSSAILSVNVGGGEWGKSGGTQHGHRVGEAKFLAVELAARLTNKTGHELGQHFGGISLAAVSIIRRKIRTGEYDVSAIITQLTGEIRGSSR